MTIRARADALLTQTSLLQTLSAYGSTHIVGSYVTDLMVYPDLDFYMDSASLTPDAYHALFRDLLGLLHPDRCEGFLDMEKNTAFIGMETTITGERWNLDLWWKSADAIRTAQASAQHMISCMDAHPELKAAILTIKQALCDQNLYGLDKGKQHYHSQDIYAAVFSEGIRTAKEFMNNHPLS